MIILNGQNGSRTIVHHRGNMPEIELKDFQKLDLKKYDWIHFEGGFHSKETMEMYALQNIFFVKLQLEFLR